MAKRWIWGTLLSVCFWLTGCGGGSFSTVPQTKLPEEASWQVESISVRNYVNQGKNIQRFTRPPQRIAVVGFSELETLLAFGLERNIVLARSYYDPDTYLYPTLLPAAHVLGKVLPMTPDVETVLMERPDIIISQQCFFTPRGLGNTDFWNERGIATYVPFNTNNPLRHEQRESVALEIAFLNGLGKIFHKEETAKIMTENIYRVIEEVRSKTTHLKAPSVMVIEYMGKHITSYDRTKLAGDMVHLLGGYIPETPPVVPKEYLLQIDPEVLFVIFDGRDGKQTVNRIVQDPALQSLRAVQHKRVYGIQLEYVYSSEVRTADGLKQLAMGMYPETNFSFSADMAMCIERRDGVCR